MLITLTYSQPSKYYVKRAICNKKAHNTFMQGNQLTALQKSLYYSNHYRTIITDNSFLSGQVNYTQHLIKLALTHLKSYAFRFDGNIFTIIVMKCVINRYRILNDTVKRSLHRNCKKSLTHSIIRYYIEYFRVKFNCGYNALFARQCS